MEKPTGRWDVLVASIITLGVLVALCWAAFIPYLPSQDRQLDLDKPPTSSNWNKEVANFDAHACYTNPQIDYNDGLKLEDCGSNICPTFETCDTRVCADFDIFAYDKPHLYESESFTVKVSGDWRTWTVRLDCVGANMDVAYLYGQYHRCVPWSERETAEITFHENGNVVHTLVVVYKGDNDIAQQCVNRPLVVPSVKGKFTFPFDKDLYPPEKQICGD